MTAQQADGFQKIIGWCANNIGPMVNAGVKVSEIAGKCLQETFPDGNSPMKIDSVEDYILACLS